jgi:hypothetical protein
MLSQHIQQTHLNHGTSYFLVWVPQGVPRGELPQRARRYFRGEGQASGDIGKVKDVIFAGIGEVKAAVASIGIQNPNAVVADIGFGWKGGSVAENEWKKLGAADIEKNNLVHCTGTGLAGHDY